MARIEIASLVLVALILLVAVPRYAVAFQAAEPPLDLWGRSVAVSPVTGLLFALGYEGAAFLGVLSGMRLRRHHERYGGRATGRTWWWPAAGAAVQAAVGFLGILTPVFLAGLRGVGVADLLSWPLDLAWCSLVAASPLLASVTVSLSLATARERKRGREPAAVAAVPAAAVRKLGGKRKRYRDAVYRVLEADAGAELKAIATETGCSVSAASRWRKRWREGRHG